jgi:hypothetical protein
MNFCNLQHTDDAIPYVSFTPALVQRSLAHSSQAEYALTSVMTNRSAAIGFI